MLFGCVGAVIALLATLSTMSPPDPEYRLSVPQLPLKIPTDAVTAFAAVIALNTGAFSSIAITDNKVHWSSTQSYSATRDKLQHD